MKNEKLLCPICKEPTYLVGGKNPRKDRLCGKHSTMLLKKENTGKGIKVTTSGNRIYVDVYVIMKYGVSISAVAEALKEAIKYKVEGFTGMVVDTVNVNVIGVKL